MKNLPKATAQKIDKFVKIAQELRSGTTKYFSITCLTSIKSLCKEPEIAARFATYLAEKIQHKVNSEYSPQYIDPVDWASYKALINEVVPLLQAHVELPTAETLASLESLLPMLGANRQFTGKVYWGRPLISIKSSDVLIVEYAVQCVLSPLAASSIAYDTAREYCECYNPNVGTGLIADSLPMLEDVIGFWYE